MSTEEVVAYVKTGLAVNFGITFAAYVLAAILQTEKFYDLIATGNLVLLTWKSLQWGGADHPRLYIQSACATLWALRFALHVFDELPVSEVSTTLFNYVLRHTLY